MPTPRRLLAAAVEGEAIYAFGGCGSPCFAPPLHTSTFEETRLEVYNYKDRVWAVRKPIPAILFGAAVATVKDKIYLFGGYVTGGDTYEYDPKGDTWKRRAPMPTPRHGLAAVALPDGKVYILGGSNGSTATGALEVYDPKNDSWSRKAPMPTPRVFLAAAEVGGKIYAIGGSPDCCGNSRTDAVEVYDPKTNSWSRAAPLPVALQTSAAAAMNGRIYVFGGFIPGSGVQGSTYEYDPEMNKWTSKASMLDPRDQAPAVVLGGIAHVIGGSVDCHCQARSTHDGYTPPPPPVKPPVADLVIRKTSDPSGAVCPGQTVEYSIEVTNRGPDAVSGASVTDDFGRLRKSGLRNIRWCRGEGCTPSRLDDLRDTVTLEVDKPPVVYTVTGTVAPTATGTLRNTASVAPPDGVTDPESVDNINTSEALNPIVRDCSVSITKTADRSEAAPGDSLRYTITVNNQGPAAVNGATVTDNLGDSGLRNVRWCRGAGCTPASPGNLRDTVRLPANGTVTYEVTGTVPCACETTQIENTACVTAPGQPEDCSATTVPIVPTPGGGLALTITGPGDLRDCGPQPYTFMVANEGPGIACGAVLLVEPPAGSEMVSISSPCFGLPCSLGNIAPGSRIEVTATFSLPEGLHCPATLRTTATVATCDSARSTVEAKIPCVLSVTKSDGLDTAASGDPILYTIGVKNEGCVALKAEVEDVFPAGLEDVRWCRGAGCVPSESLPLPDTLDLPAGGMETYRAAGTVALAFTGELINTVTVSPPESETVSATDKTTVIPVPPLVGLIAFCEDLSGPSFDEGEIITKTFVISNHGDVVQGDNPGPEFEDVLPAGLSLVGASADSGTVTTVPVDNAVRWSGSIPPGGTVTVQIMATINLGTLGMRICNGATTFFDTDGDGVNESSRPADAPCCLQVGPGAMVPSLSDPGLVALILLLCALALARLRRRDYP